MCNVNNGRTLGLFDDAYFSVINEKFHAKSLFYKTNYVFDTWEYICADKLSFKRALKES